MIEIGSTPATTIAIDPHAYPALTWELLARLVDAGMEIDPDNLPVVILTAVQSHLRTVAPNACVAIEHAVWRMVQREQRAADAKRSIERGQAAAASTITRVREIIAASRGRQAA